MKRAICGAMILCAVQLCVFEVGQAAELSGEEILRTADARIKKHRMGDLVIEVVDEQGNPLQGAKVKVEQMRHKFLFGCNIFHWGRIEEPQLERKYRERFAALFNYATLPFYWPSYERIKGAPRHEYTREVAQWCKEHGIACKGHPLAWNYADPPWLPNDPDEVMRLQLARIDDCVTRFRGLVEYWDVVNEATHFDREAFAQSAPRITATWKKVGQVEFARRCFLQARKANPDAVLLINDYRTDPAYERIIEQLVDDEGKKLYDAIGIQSHMHGGTWPTERIWEICNRFSRFGVPLHFTETTILSGQLERRPRPNPWVTTPEGEKYQAEEVERFYTVLFSHPAVEAITWWDFSDYRAWKGAPAGLLRRDMSPKPAYEVLMKLVKGKWWTRTEGHTNSRGQFSCRAFLGAYRITASYQGKTVEAKFNVEDRQNVLKLVLETP